MFRYLELGDAVRVRLLEVGRDGHATHLVRVRVRSRVRVRVRVRVRHAPRTCMLVGVGL